MLVSFQMNRLSLPMHEDEDEDDVVDLCRSTETLKVCGAQVS